MTNSIFKYNFIGKNLKKNKFSKG